MERLAGAAYRLPDEDIPAVRGRVPGLDGLRALSIGIVLVGHFFMGDNGGFSSLGVYIFFVISGFLIARLAFAEKKGTGRFVVGAFFFRRICRLYPVLIVYMLAIMLFAGATRQPIRPLEVVSVFGYFVNYLRSWYEYAGQSPALPIGTLWSLAVEEHFYVIAPFVFLSLSGRPKAMLWFALIMSIVPLCLRILYLWLVPAFIGTDIIYRLSETRFDSIAAGVLLAVLCELPNGRAIVRRASSPRAFAAGMAILLLSYVLRNPIYKDTLRYTMRNIGCFFLVAQVVFGMRARYLQVVFNLSPMAWIGRISYSIYIWHGAMVYFFKPWWVGHGLAYGMALLAGTIACAVASYYLVEMPALRLKKYWRPGRKAPPGDPVSPVSA